MFGKLGGKPKPAASHAVDGPRFEKVDWKRGNLRRLYALAGVLMIASATTGYDNFLFGVSQQFDTWQEFFGYPRDDANRLGLMNNMYNIGSICSMFIFPLTADRYGRKINIVVGCAIMVAGSFITAFSKNWQMFMGGRFVLGFGNSLAQMGSPMLLTEICHPAHRGPVTAVYNCLWNLGAFVVSWVALGTVNVTNDWSWRSITLLQMFPSVIQLTFMFWVPESPRWLIAKERNEEALEILAYYHGEGDANNEVVQFEYREIDETLRIERQVQKRTSYLDFFRTKGNRWRLAIIVSLGVISQYSGNAMISSYQDAIYIGAGITNQTQKLSLTGGQKTLDLIVAIAAALTVDRFGRRPLFLVAITGMFLSFVCWTAMGVMFEKTDGAMAYGYTQLVFIWIFGIFYDIGFSGLLVAYTLEVLPFSLRAKGMMIMNVTVQAFLALGAQTNMLAWNNLPHHWNFMLFYTLWDFVELVFVYFVYVETKGPTLEEIARIFDGDDAATADIDLDQMRKELFVTTTAAEHHENTDSAKMRRPEDA